MSVSDYMDLDEAERLRSERIPEHQPLTFVNASSWQDKPIPRRQWLVPNRIPMKNVTLLQGDGGMGKTTLALQLAVAVDQAAEWLGSMSRALGPQWSFQLKKMTKNCTVELLMS
jgi:hypothetical protein